MFRGTFSEASGAERQKDQEVSAPWAGGLTGSEGAATSTSVSGQRLYIKKAIAYKAWIRR